MKQHTDGGVWLLNDKKHRKITMYDYWMTRNSLQITQYDYWTRARNILQLTQYDYWMRAWNILQITQYDYWMIAWNVLDNAVWLLDSMKYLTDNAVWLDDRTKYLTDNAIWLLDDNTKYFTNKARQWRDVKCVMQPDLLNSRPDSHRDAALHVKSLYTPKSRRRILCRATALPRVHHDPLCKTQSLSYSAK
jgi:hypothetical protein